ncbi:hypothetical protein X946_5286 [Burkholderia sp. ABCPW 111]|nr:hypothetical protein X946_5286 [Burkholderia sp. ABCPW 111]
MIVNVCSSISIGLPVVAPSGRAEMSTAITKSAPILRANDAGTGLTSPPSTYSRSPIRTGSNTDGTLHEARTASPVLPRWNRIGWPLFRSVATMPSGFVIFSIGRLPSVLLMKFCSATPCSRPRERNGVAQSLIDASSIASASLLICSAFIPDAYSAPTTEPALVPATSSIGMPRASSAFSTPTCAKPRAAPPPSAMPIRTGFSRGCGGFAGSVTAPDVVGFVPVDVQAARMADAQASVNVRRDKRGDDIGSISNCGPCAAAMGAPRTATFRRPRRKLRAAMRGAGMAAAARTS